MAKSGRQASLRWVSGSRRIIFVAPSRRGIIGDIASEVFRSRYGGLKGLRSPDFPLLSRLLGGDGPAHGELLSYLLFDRDFIDALIDLGRADAARWFGAPPGLRSITQVPKTQTPVGG